MPHQCLKCGSLFSDGTTTILRGCPDCRGTRFFYTQEPLGLSERERLLDQSDRDIPALAERVPAAAPAFTAALESDRGTPPSLLPGTSAITAEGNLLVRLPKSLEQRLKRAEGWDYVAPVPNEVASLPPPPAPAPISAGFSPSPASSEMPTWSAKEQAPETVRIKNQGEYEIDVRRLLEKSPIVIHRDGTYLLHLPSLFEAGRAEPDKDA